MARNILTLRELGYEAGWLLIQQALGMPDAKMQSDFMEDKVAVLMFSRRSLPERLCVTAAVRQMGGTTIFEGDQGGVWREEIQDYQKHMFPIMGYYIDCMYTYGFPVKESRDTLDNLPFPIINAGSPNAHPAHTLADLVCMMRKSPNLEGIHAAWIGSDNGTLHSLIETTAWFPFSLSISLPPEVDASKLKKRASELKSKIVFAESPLEAVKGANFIFAGKRSEFAMPEISTWSITAELMTAADPDARLLLSASPLRAIPVDIKILSSKASLLIRQAEYRLRIHKRMLHWVFQSR